MEPRTCRVEIESGAATGSTGVKSLTQLLQEIAMPTNRIWVTALLAVVLVMTAPMRGLRTSLRNSLASALLSTSWFMLKGPKIMRRNIRMWRVLAIVVSFFHELRPRRLTDKNVPLMDYPSSAFGKHRRSVRSFPTRRKHGYVRTSCLSRKITRRSTGIITVRKYLIVFPRSGFQSISDSQYVFAVQVSGFRY
jgi:hypothetical protein